MRVAAELFIIGRTKDLIIVHGKNIVAHQIEELMAAIQGIKPGRSVAFGVHDEFEGSEGLVVVAELSRGDIPVSRHSPRRARVHIQRRGHLSEQGSAHRAGMARQDDQRKDLA